MEIGFDRKILHIKIYAYKTNETTVKDLKLCILFWSFWDINAVV